MNTENNKEIIENCVIICKCNGLLKNFRFFENRDVKNYYIMWEPDEDKDSSDFEKIRTKHTDYLKYLISVAEVNPTRITELSVSLGKILSETKGSGIGIKRSLVNEEVIKKRPHTLYGKINAIEITMNYETFTQYRHATEGIHELDKNRMDVLEKFGVNIALFQIDLPKSVTVEIPLLKK